MNLLREFILFSLLTQLSFWLPTRLEAQNLHESNGWLLAYCGGTSSDSFVEILALEKGFIASGISISYAQFPGSSRNAWVVRTDHNGNVLWQTSFIEGEVYSVYRSFLNQRGELILTGRGRKTPDGGIRLWIGRLDTLTGEVHESYTYRTHPVEIPNDGILVNDTTILFAGTHSMSGHPNPFWMARVSTDGEIISEVTFGEEDDASIQNLLEGTDSTCLAIGEVDLPDDTYTFDRTVAIFTFDYRGILLRTARPPDKFIRRIVRGVRLNDSTLALLTRRGFVDSTQPPNSMVTYSGELLLYNLVSDTWSDIILDSSIVYSDLGVGKVGELVIAGYDVSEGGVDRLILSRYDRHLDHLRTDSVNLYGEGVYSLPRLGHGPYMGAIVAGVANAGVLALERD